MTDARLEEVRNKIYELLDDNDMELELDQGLYDISVDIVFRHPVDDGFGYSILIENCKREVR